MEKIYLLFTMILCLYSTTAAWLLSYVFQVEYLLMTPDVSKKWFVAVVVPMILSNVLTLMLLAYHPDSVPVGMVYLAAVIALLMLYRTFIFPIFTFKKLEKEAILKQYLQQNNKNLPVWLLSSVVLVYMVFKNLVIM